MNAGHEPAFSIQLHYFHHKHENPLQKYLSVAQNYKPRYSGFTGPNGAETKTGHVTDSRTPKRK